MTSASTSGQAAQSAANHAQQHQQQQQQQQSLNHDNKPIDEILASPLKNIDSSLFNALQSIDLGQLDGKDLTIVIPFLTKLLLNPSFIGRHKVLKLLYPLSRSSEMIQFLSVRALDSQDTINVPPISSFEQCQPRDRIRVVALEYLNIHEKTNQINSYQQTNQAIKLQGSKLFDNALYIDHITPCLFALLHKTTNIPAMNILDMSEALLHLKHGPTYIVRLIVNMPDRCQEVCNSLITFGERQDEGATFNEVSDQRAQTLRLLCLMNPSIAYTVRSTTLHMHKMPSLTIMITLDHLTKTMQKYNSAIEERMTDSDEVMLNNSPKEVVAATRELEDSFDSAIAFITGILLGVEDGTRVWFSQYTKFAQQKRIDQSNYSVMSTFRLEILNYVHSLFPSLLDNDSYQNEDQLIESESIKCNNKKLIRATATLRLFCSLRGIGMLKLNHEECETLLSLLTSKPTVNQTSVNFATTGVCTLLACSMMINNQKDERRAADWLKWLIKESKYSDGNYSGNGKCSISEFLLLIAIHFQNNQTAQIADLVCATLGMKLQIKPSVSKCKSLFVQEVFNEQMIAEHAVKVPVTRGLSDTMKEFLPIHCIHQLLESRSFSKHQVPIQEWIYKQICESKKPVHHMLPKLIEAYVNTIIIATSAHGHCGTNQPFAEEDIIRVFETKLYSLGHVSNRHDNSIQADVKKTCRRNQSIDSMDVMMLDTIMDEGLSEQQTNDEKIHVIDVEVSQVLLLYYLLLYEDVKLKKSADLTAIERAKLVKYSPDLMMEIPIFYLLQLVRDNQESFGTILPDLIKLVASHHPQLCSIEHWLTTEHYEPYRAKSNQNNGQTAGPSLSSIKKTGECLGSSTAAVLGISIENASKKSTPTLKSELKNQLIENFKSLIENPQALTKTINNITMLSRDEVWNFVVPFIDNWTKILQLHITELTLEHEKLIQAATRLWWKLNTIFPRKLWIMTVNSLRRMQGIKASYSSETKTSLEHSWDELTLDPLIVLRCDSRVYRCPEILAIILHILNAFLAASKRCLQDHINEQPDRQKESRNFEELKTTLVLAQTSAAIQILLESFHPSEEERDAMNKRDACPEEELSIQESILLKRLDTSIDCICEHLHQVFIADTNIAKLVHFQTYPSELLATTSDKIPSMHICLDFIPELLSQPDLTKQVFVVELTSHLCEKYAITKSLNVAKLCFNVAYTLLQLLPSDKRASFYVPVLPALLRICRVFSILQEDARIILNQIDQITIAHLASTSSRLSLGSSRPFEGLDKMDWREVKKLMQSLNSNEALYMCIQKCSLELDKMETSERQRDPIEEASTQLAYSTIFAYGNHVINPSRS